MRSILALSVLVVLAACAAQPSTSERALLSAPSSRAAQIDADVQSILHGMQNARSRNERVARYNR